MLTFSWPVIFVLGSPVLQRSKTVTRLGMVVISVGVATSTCADDRKRHLSLSLCLQLASSISEGQSWLWCNWTAINRSVPSLTFRTTCHFRSVRMEAGWVQRTLNYSFLIHGFVSAFAVVQQGYWLKSTNWLDLMKQSRYWAWDLLLFPVCFTPVCNCVQTACLSWFLFHSSYLSGFKNCCFHCLAHVFILDVA